MLGHRPQSLSTLRLGTQNQVNLEAWTAQSNLVVLEEERGPESSHDLTKVTQTIRASPWLLRRKQLGGRESGRVRAGEAPGSRAPREGVPLAQPSARHSDAAWQYSRE